MKSITRHEPRRRSRTIWIDPLDTALSSAFRVGIDRSLRGLCALCDLCGFGVRVARRVVASRLCRIISGATTPRQFFALRAKTEVERSSIAAFTKALFRSNRCIAAIAASASFAAIRRCAGMKSLQGSATVQARSATPKSWRRGGVAPWRQSLRAGENAGASASGRRTDDQMMTLIIECFCAAACT